MAWDPLRFGLIREVMHKVVAIDAGLLRIDPCCT
jgi:hypothetical protein